VPDIRGSTRRLDLNATAIWRNERPWGYLEAGFGGYLLSKTINNQDTRVPSAFEFGSHIGIGFKLGPGTLGFGLQHLSNAGIKQPNGGIDLVFVQYTLVQ
jgi:lipid A 3-O-deacylase